MADPSPKPQHIFPSQAQLQEALSQIGGEIKDQPLRSSSLARIMRETFGGSDASSAWDCARSRQAVRSLPSTDAGDTFQPKPVAQPQTRLMKKNIVISENLMS
jgi:hypothetical protein